MVKASAYNVGDPGSIPGSGRSPGEGNGNLFLYSCLENPMDRGSWWATVHGVPKSQTRLSDFTFWHPNCATILTEPIPQRVGKTSACWKTRDERSHRTGTRLSSRLGDCWMSAEMSSVIHLGKVMLTYWCQCISVTGPGRFPSDCHGNMPKYFLISLPIKQWQRPRSPEKESGEVGETLAGCLPPLLRGQQCCGLRKSYPKGPARWFLQNHWWEGMDHDRGDWSEGRLCSRADPEDMGAAKRVRERRKELCIGQQQPQEVEGQKAIFCSRKQQTFLECLSEANSKGPQMPKLPLSSDNSLFKLIN